MDFEKLAQHKVIGKVVASVIILGINGLVWFTPDVDPMLRKDVAMISLGSALGLLFG